MRGLGEGKLLKAKVVDLHSRGVWPMSQHWMAGFVNNLCGLLVVREKAGSSPPLCGCSE